MHLRATVGSDRSCSPLRSMSRVTMGPLWTTNNGAALLRAPSRPPQTHRGVRPSVCVCVCAGACVRACVCVCVRTNTLAFTQKNTGRTARICFYIYIYIIYVIYGVDLLLRYSCYIRTPGQQMPLIIQDNPDEQFMEVKEAVDREINQSSSALS